MAEARSGTGSLSAPAGEVVETLLSNQLRFLSFLEKRVGDRTLAEDILQDAFVRGIAQLGTLQRDESAVAWFYRLLRNAVIDQRRRGTSAARKLEAFAHELESAAETNEEVHRAVCQCVEHLARTLKPEYAEALGRVEVEGVSVKAYADSVGISPNNAAVRVFRAREALRKQLTLCCGRCAEDGCLDCSCGPVAGS